MQNIDLKYKLIYRLRKECVLKAMHELDNLEYIYAEAVEQYKEQKINDLLRFAVENIPFYKDCLKPFAHLDDAPIIDKQIIRNNLKELMATGIDISWRSTSGTTGSPLVFPKDRWATSYMDAMMYNAYSWHGIQMGDKQARLWGRAIKKKQMLIQCAKDMILRRKRLSAFKMNDENCHSYFNNLQKFKPKYFYSYSNALYQFANYVENNKLNGKSLEIATAICTGEVLFAYQRDKIEEIFGCKVVNEYGSTENGIIGFECEHGSMHIMPTVYAEILNPDETGLGQIVITELNSRSIPFIRYKIGDTGRILKKECKCNRPFDIIEIHEGRIDDYIRCPDGRVVYDAILAYTLKDFASQFKAYQENIDLLRIYIVPCIDFDENSAEKIRKSLCKYLGDEIKIEIVQVKELPHDPSGKFRYFISRIKNEVL